MLKDGLGRRNPIIWKSKLSKRVVGSTLAGETMSVVEGVKWVEYMRYLWEEINGTKKDKERMRIVVKTNCKSLAHNIKSETGVKNRMLCIDLLNIKYMLFEGKITNIEWMHNRDQLADGLTKERSKNKIWKLIKVNSGNRKQRKKENRIRVIVLYNYI